jgi:2-oxoglutarate dehydrogenase E2 component (dihydrolipoamide succinyltransferase)
MSVQIKVPTLGESVTEATVAKWFKQVGEQVEADEPIVELETDKVTLELNAPASGSLSEIAVEEGAEVEVGAVLGSIEEGEGAPAAKPEHAPAPARQEPQAEARPRAGAADGEAAATAEEERRGDGALSPAVRKLLDEAGIDPAEITPSGPKGNITKGDVLAAIEARQQAGGRAPQPEPAPEREAPVTRGRPEAAPEPTREVREQPAAEPPPPAPAARAPERREAPAGREERVKMTRLRRRIAERLKEAQNTAAILTTYNEADMSAVMALRSRYRDVFEKKHGVRLGFMSFFVKASINALQAFPAVNAEIDGDEVVYKHHYDIGVAVSTPSGLVVPVVRDADGRGFAQLETEVNDLGLRARDGKLAMEELTGGTFTISNGGVYGSLMSAPILNPPQVGILGMHKIEERPVVVGGEITIRPMMYLALSYDHRIVDGREAVSFLVRVKECIEDPERLLLDI